MTSTIRSLFAGGMILGACALVMPVETASAQGNSGKAKSAKVQKQKAKTTRPV